MSVEFDWVFQAPFFLSISSVCITVVIAADQYRLRRDLKNIELQHKKDKIRSLMVDIQIKNNILRNELEYIISGKNVPSYIAEYFPEKFIRLKDKVDFVRSELSVYRGDDCQLINLRSQIWAMNMSDHIFYPLYQKDYEFLLHLTKDIEKHCTQFTGTTSRAPFPKNS